jgi:hypothetical protein
MDRTATCLTAELRALAERLPVPADAWHPHVASIRAVRDDLLAGLDLLERLPDGEARLAEAIEAGEAATPGTPLAALPVPEGEHPYLGEILAALEAARAVQAALGAASLAA